MSEGQQYGRERERAKYRERETNTETERDFNKQREKDVVAKIVLVANKYEMNECRMTFIFNTIDILI